MIPILSTLTRGQWIGGTVGLVMLVSMLGLGGCWVNGQLEQAERARIEAQALAEKALEERAEAIAEADTKVKEAQEKERAAMDRERAALERAAAAQRRADAAQREVSRILSERDRVVSEIADQSDQSLADFTARRAFEAYPDERRPLQFVARAEGGFVLNRPALEVTQTAFVDVRSQRDVIDQKDQQIQALQDRITESIRALDEKGVQLEAAAEKLDACRLEVGACETALEAQVELVTALEEENKALRRKNWWQRWGSRAAQVGALLAGVVIGRQI
jgi:hypothetical protein